MAVKFDACCCCLLLLLLLLLLLSSQIDAEDFPTGCDTGIQRKTSITRVKSVGDCKVLVHSSYRGSSPNQIEPLVCVTHQQLTGQILPLRYNKVREKLYFQLKFLLHNSAVLDRVRNGYQVGADKINFMPVEEIDVINNYHPTGISISSARVDADGATASIHVYCSRESQCVRFWSAIQEAPENFFETFRLRLSVRPKSNCYFAVKITKRLSLFNATVNREGDELSEAEETQEVVDACDGSKPVSGDIGYRGRLGTATPQFVFDFSRTCQNVVGDGDKAAATGGFELVDGVGLRVASKKQPGHLTVRLDSLELSEVGSSRIFLLLQLRVPDPDSAVFPIVAIGDCADPSKAYRLKVTTVADSDKTLVLNWREPGGDADAVGRVRWRPANFSAAASSNGDFVVGFRFLDRKAAVFADNSFEHLDRFVWSSADALDGARRGEACLTVKQPPPASGFQAIRCVSLTVGQTVSLESVRSLVSLCRRNATLDSAL